MEEVDNDKFARRPGGIFTVCTEGANWLGLFFFLAGLIAIGVFVCMNLGTT